MKEENKQGENEGKMLKRRKTEKRREEFKEKDSK
jgi:hypothetical protein